MTTLTYAARNMLVQAPEVQALITAGKLGGGPNFTTWKDGWIFADYPYANIEKRSAMALVVVTFGGAWQSPNPHNSARFPRLLVDVWASPTRLSDGSVQRPDADMLIEEVMDAMLPYLHTVHRPVPGGLTTPAFMGTAGLPRVWGTAEEIANRTGVHVLSSELLSEPEFSDVRDGNGARMGRYSFGVARM